MDQHYDDFFEHAQKASGKGKFMKLPRFQKNLKFIFDGLYSYNTKITHLDLRSRTRVKLGKCSQTSTTHCNYAHRDLEDRIGFRGLMSN